MTRSLRREVPVHPSPQQRVKPIISGVLYTPATARKGSTARVAPQG